MDIIRRNFLTLLKSGALNEYGNIEPMSSFKWEQLFKMAVMHNVSSFVYKGLKHHQYDKEFNVPNTILHKLEEVSNQDNAFDESTKGTSVLSNLNTVIKILPISAVIFTICKLDNQPFNLLKSTSSPLFLR